MKAADRFKDPPARVNELWQTDFSRYIITWKLCKNMRADDVERVVSKALDITGLAVDERPRLLSDNGSCYVSGEIVYGRTKYDCSTGTLLFSAPDQTYSIKDIVISSESWFIAFHEDFIRGLDIRKLIKNYNFFNYNVNEALHLSPKEELTVKSIFRNIEAEYQQDH